MHLKPKFLLAILVVAFGVLLGTGAIEADPIGAPQITAPNCTVTTPLPCAVIGQTVTVTAAWGPDSDQTTTPPTDYGDAVLAASANIGSFAACPSSSCVSQSPINPLDVGVDLPTVDPPESGPPRLTIHQDTDDIDEDTLIQAQFTCTSQGTTTFTLTHNLVHVEILRRRSACVATSATGRLHLTLDDTRWIVADRPNPRCSRRRKWPAD